MEQLSDPTPARPRTQLGRGGRLAGTSIRRRQRARGTGYEVRYRDSAGAQRSRTFDDLPAARRFLSEVRSQVDDGTYVSPAAGRTTFGAVAAAWFAGTADLKVRTRVAYRSVLDHNLAGWDAVPVGEFTYRRVQDLIDAMVAVGRAPATVRNVVLVARHVFEEARKQQLIRTNPCTGLRLPRLVVAPSTFLTQRQVRDLAAALASPFDLLVLTAVGTGLRAGELAGLRVEDLELDRRRLHVRHSVTYAHGELTLERPKTAAALRAVPIARPLAARLERRTEGLQADDYVFGEGPLPLWHNRFYLLTFKPAVLEAGLPPRTRFHDLRHTYASLMIAEEVHPKRLSTWMGHTSVAITMDRYGHLYDDDLETPSGLDNLYSSNRP